MRKKAKRTHSHVLCNFIEILYVFWAKFIAKFIFPWRVPSLLCLCIDLLLLIRSWNELKEGQAFHMNFISCFSDIWIGKEGWLRAKSVKITNISPYETNNTALFPTWLDFRPPTAGLCGNSHRNLQWEAQNPILGNFLKIAVSGPKLGPT